ncbi:MAG: hypothetical protein L6R36_001537 [Xanthoria steineri]|nr:MAG: hypothetical protein L6R36_001537 [Xanthoria steineri]
MSSRYPPPEQSESRFATRDRSPPRFPDRRASGAYSSGPQTSRVADTNYRSFDSNTHHREPPREPPRGPKAYVDPPRGNFPPRGRGFSRGDFRDREYRDPRDGVIARGGSHRDWSHRASADTRDRRISPPGRGRTRSPPRRDYGRDSRDLTSRDIDRDRPRPDVLAEVPHSAGFRGRPSFRARGRGDWDYGHRGRGSFADERDSFRVRSTSGDRNRDRNPREDRDRDRDQELPRRDEDYRRPWEDKDRDSRRDPPFRPDSRNSSGANPSTPLSSTGPMSNQLNVDRSSHAYRGPSSDSSRRSSGPNVASDYGNSVKDPGRMDVTLHRPDRDRLPVQPPSPPPQAPEVPAFGSISYRQPTIEQGAPTPKKSGTSDFSASPCQIGQGTARQPPSAPKAQLLGQMASITKVEQHSERLPLTEQKPPISRTTNDDRYLSGAVPVHPTVPSGPRLSSGDNTAGDPMSRALPTSSNKRPPTENSHSRLSGQHAGSQMAAKATSLQLVHPSRREVVAESLRQDTVAPFPSRPTHREISIPGQPSPAKVPTGPRAERSAPSIRQIVPPAPRVPPQRHVNPSRRGGQPNLTWVRPGLSQGPPQHAPRGPSIMNTVPTKRDNAGEDRAKSPPPDQEERENNDIAWPRGGSSLKDALDQAKAEGDNLHAASKERRHRSGTESPRVEAQALPTKQASTHGPVSEGPQRVEPDTGPEDSAMDLDDDDFEVAERKFNRKLQVLEARRPPTPRHHQELLALLEECDALASAAEDLATGVIPQLPRELAPTKIPASGLPSPKAEADENVEMDVDLHHNASPSLVRRLSPPIEGLPFLVAGPPTPLSEIEDLQDFSLHELVKSRILKQLQIQDEEVEVQYEEDKQQFAEDYRSWRWKNIELEEQEKARNDAAPPPAPVETAPVIGCAITSISGTRRVRNTSESQMEEVLKISEKTAADEELRRTHQLADRGPNHDKEAVVPDMLSLHESKAMLFVDTNNFVPGDGVLQALAFAPRKDDFTDEEHDKFIDQYILNPKRWGAIAAEIPGRNYQDCVQHYYLTKASCMYKEKEKAFLRIKKGRRGPRGPQNRAKSSNLMPAYDGNTELDPGSAAVTETGRPKRTAAPVFGATSDVEGATPAATPIRRNLVLSKVDTNGETNVEKPRRRGAGAPKEKGAKRGKAVLLAAAPGPSPQKGDRDAGRGKSREPKPEAEQVLDDLESAPGLQQSQVSAMPPAQSISIENWMTRQSMSVPTNLAGAQKSQQPLFEAQIPPPQHQRSGQLTSSYWSVPEHQDFQNLLGHFGTNWQAIADTMKTKSVTMVRNYYNRASQKEENEFLKKIALEADERIKRGEDMGPPPAPTTQNKRRAENTPQLPPQRPLAPSVDQLDIETESSQAQATKPVLISSPQAQTSQPRYQTLAQAEPTPTAPFSVSANQGLVNVIPRTQQQSSHQRTTSLQGPRSGFFSDERPRSLVQAQASTDSQKSQQQQRQNLAEDEASRIRRLETQQRAEALKRQQKQDFLDKLEQQHQGRQSEQVQGTMQPQPPVRNHSTPVSQPFLAPSQPTSSQVRIAPSQPLELDTRPRIGNQSQQSQFDRMQQEPSPAMRRIDPVISGRVRQSALQSPASARIPLALSPLDENARVGSTPAMPTPAPPPRPSPAPAKRSNIMSILNDEPSEPPAPRRKAEDVPSVGPMPTQHSPTTLVQPFRPPSQLSQTHPARDAGHDRAVHVLQPQHRLSLSQSTTQPQQQHQSQQSVHVREKPAPWVAAAQRLGQQRANYQSPVANSPHSQPAFLQPGSRGSFQSIQRSHAPSPPPAPFSHSRTPSYTSGPTQLASQQPMPAHQAQQAGSQGHAAPNLQSSPYTTIQPHQTPQGAQHHMQLQIQRQQDEQRHADLQRRARQEAILQQEAAHHHQQHQQQHFQQHQQSFEASRRPSEQTTFLRPKEGGSVETERSRELLVLLMREEQERKLEQTRREQGRVFTPPVYPGHGYGPPTGPQQQPGLGHGRYEERR